VETMSFLLIHRRVAALLGALSAPLYAQTVPEAAIAPESPASVPISRPAGSALAGLLPAVRRDSRLLSAEPSLSTFGVVELPPENGMANARRHHAVSIPFHAAGQTARRLGLDATDCAFQFRMPAHLKRDPMAGARSTVDVQAQVRLACRM